ncbi:orotidine 5'-phosphate decarboxylase [Desulfurobacterium thermolithotrophum DSM 11699]|uniref:Orotidine 5'-phosphate decarboxylase n=1 Tax=Desulfurobacterium thermolithotrophum (strain DSM 11699 / BSA) TaxID=868864 RepID=F0S0V7_DESTD|nr:orotidine-5'-phosphate decarboxylase [Desulfurobacterium thermolithotrophum]ADY72761.1 orotidine 5'-phosphate decarboxylase [Desulfurobacterium thermolithotrophum DSM 11699]
MIIVALDFDSKEKALSLVDRIKGKISHFKVGLELFSRCGIEVVKEISYKNCKVFLDLKYHDIPNTVKSAAKVAVEAGVWMYNIHALGGFEFMKSVAEFNKEYAQKIGVERPLLIAVTILTSMGNEDLKQIGINTDVETEVLKLAELAKKAGLDGIVCSAMEVKKIKENLGEDFLTVTPGIRPAWASKDDQKRIVTPADAVKLGTDYMVIGRPITRAEDPKEAAEKILEEINS